MDAQNIHIRRLNLIDRTPVKSFDDSHIMLYSEIYQFPWIQYKSYSLLVFINTSLYLHQLFTSGNVYTSTSILRVIRKILL